MRQDNAIGLAVLLALATFAGNLGAASLNKLVFDADTKLETNVQLIELAIGILSAPLPETDNSFKAEGGEGQRGVTRDKALRIWAVDTINAFAEIKFDGDARDQLIDGKTQLPAASMRDLQRIYELATQSQTKMTDAEVEARMRQLSKEAEGMTQEEVDRHLRERANQP